ncbi:Rsd/AlgQ family anti-sigma factor, partial [Cronobacter sakazakii]
QHPCLESQDAAPGIGEPHAARFVMQAKLIMMAFDHNLGESANREAGLANRA